MSLKYFNLNDFEGIKNYYNENGYVIIENVISQTMINKIMEDIYNKEIFPDPVNNERIQDLWKNIPCAKKVAANKDIYNLLKKLYNCNPLPFQTLNFANGTKQPEHVDLVHFCPSIDNLNLMCGVWYAFEDIDNSKGPLIYYPGSHKLPHIVDFNKLELKNYGEYIKLIQQIIKIFKIQRVSANIKKGSAIIWNSNLIHGGHPHKVVGTTRYSMVTHYFFDKSAYWYTPLQSIGLKNKAMRNNIIDTANEILK